MGLYSGDATMIQSRTPNNDIVQWADNEGFSEIAARVIASRFNSVDAAKANLKPHLRALTPPHLLPDIDTACSAIIETVELGGVICNAVDYDNDGSSSAAVLYRALTEVFEVPSAQVCVRSGDRFTEGYGLSAGLAQRIIQEFSHQRVLVITADMGSSDQARIELLKASGIPVVVTDHHAIPAEGIPTSAVAVVNPTRSDSLYGDPLIAGCGVAWLLMARLFTMWSQSSPERPCFSGDALRQRKTRLLELLAFTASGTVGDCVSLARSHNNRLMVQHGLQVMRSSNDPCWVALRGTLEQGETLDSSHISFKLAPMCNSPGRLSRADAAVNFLTTTDLAEAEQLLRSLVDENTERKRIESVMRDQAVESAAAQFEQGAACAVIYLPDGHPGVQGICASRVVEQFGRPTCIFSPKGDGSATLTASLRSVPGVHIRDALERVFSELPQDVAPTFGGHEGAAGCSIPKQHLSEFGRRLNDACKDLAEASAAPLEPVVLTDGTLPVSKISLALIEELASLGPFGREFEQPAFEIDATVHEARTMGAEHNHLRLSLVDRPTGACVNAVMFYIDRLDDFAIPVPGDSISVVAELSANWFRGNVTPQLIVKCIHPKFSGQQTAA